MNENNSIVLESIAKWKKHSDTTGDVPGRLSTIMKIHFILRLAIQFHPDNFHDDNEDNDDNHDHEK